MGALMKAFAAVILTLAVPTAAAAQTAPSVRFDNPKTMPEPRGYTHVVEVSGSHRTIYISGQLGVEASGKELTGFPEQATQVFENIKAALESVGGDWSNVVKINTFLTDIRTQLPALRPIRDKYVNTKAPPASTTVEVSRLAREGLFIEIEAIAILPAK